MPRDPSADSTNVGHISTKREAQDTFVEEMAERVRIRAKAKGFNATTLGEKVGIPSSSAANYWSGKRPWPIEAVPDLAALLDTSVEVLMLRGDHHVLSSARWSALPSDREDTVEIASVDLGYGMGGTFLDIGEAEVERVPFSRSWLRANVTDSPPEVLGVAQGIGDSMEPVLFDRDLVFFDRSARLQDHVSDKMWVFAYGQIGMIKRLRPMPDGTVKLMSANRTYPDEIASDGELHIIGRVVASLRRH